ncbi:MAG: hypothetical protein NTX80_03135, partial [Candidatus Saccharibacteria bacterium]|nr:hypothetical protein [Candidatus Saccharibacteria bacterium]
MNDFSKFELDLAFDADSYKESYDKQRQATREHLSSLMVQGYLSTNVIPSGSLVEVELASRSVAYDPDEKLRRIIGTMAGDGSLKVIGDSSDGRQLIGQRIVMGNWKIADETNNDIVYTPGTVNPDANLGYHNY